MVQKTTAPYGSWRSPISAGLVSASSQHWINQLYVEGEELYALLRLPEEGGRSVVARVLADGRFESSTPAPFDARTRVYEYGGSAGGFTTLSALAFRDYSQAGSSHYGISDLEFWDGETHKFEANYCRSLIGPYPEDRAPYRQRSPVHRAHEINAPLLIFQVLDDKVVPPNQSRSVADALRDRGVPVAHLEFEGEAHGFRRAESNVRTHQAELAFFGKVFGFRPADDFPPCTSTTPKPFTQAATPAEPAAKRKA